MFYCVSEPMAAMKATRDQSNDSYICPHTQTRNGILFPMTKTKKKTKHRFSKNIFYRLLNQMIWQIQKLVSNSCCHLNKDSWQVQKVWITQYPLMAFIKNYMTNSLIIQEFPLNKRWLARDCITSHKKSSCYLFAPVTKTTLFIFSGPHCRQTAFKNKINQTGHFCNNPIELKATSCVSGAWKA